MATFDTRKERRKCLSFYQKLKNVTLVFFTWTLVAGTRKLREPPIQNLLAQELQNPGVVPTLGTVGLRLKDAMWSEFQLDSDQRMQCGASFYLLSFLSLAFVLLRVISRNSRHFPHASKMAAIALASHCFKI